MYEYCIVCMKYDQEAAMVPKFCRGDLAAVWLQYCIAWNHAGGWQCRQAPDTALPACLPSCLPDKSGGKAVPADKIDSSGTTGLLVTS